MREFVRGVRRKVRLATHLLAYVLMAGWGRSNLFTESVEFSVCDYVFGLSSADQTLACRVGYFEGRTNDGAFIWERRSLDQWPAYQSRAFVVRNPFFPIMLTGVRTVQNPDWIWRWHRLGIGKKVGIHEATQQLFEYDLVVISPYWSLITPLTVISSCLFLTRPRPDRTKSTFRTNHSL